MRNVRKLWGILTLNERKSCITVLLLILLGTIMEMLGLSLIVPLIGVLTDPASLTNYPIPEAIIRDLNSLSQVTQATGILVLMLVVYIIKTVFMIFIAWYQAGFNLKLQASISEKMYSNYLSMDWEDFKSSNSSKYIQNTNNEVHIVIQQGFGSLLDLSTNASILVASVTILMFVNPLGTLIIGAAVVLVFWIFQNLSKIRISKWGKIRKEEEASRLQCLQQGIGCAKEIHLQNCKDIFVAEFDLHSQRLVSAGQWQSTLRKSPKYIFELLAVIALTITITSLIHSGTPITDIAPLIALFAAIFVKLLPATNSLLTNLHSIRFIEPAIDAIDQHLHMRQPRPLRGSQSLNQVGCQQFEKVQIKLDNFSYRSGTRPTLQNIDLTIDAGTSIGIIGKSGSGKSTFVDIFLGLLQPEREAVFVDGVSIQENIETWQGKIGYVPQHIYVLDDTLRRNIAFGQADIEIDHERLRRALEQAQLSGFASSLQNGLDTRLGENGSNLSGGERQRIAIARALYRDPQVLILDEATASLDPTTERAVMDSVHALKGTITTIIVTHRHSTITDCDEIITIDAGRIKSRKNNAN